MNDSRKLAANLTFVFTARHGAKDAADDQSETHDARHVSLPGGQPLDIDLAEAMGVIADSTAERRRLRLLDAMGEGGG